MKIIHSTLLAAVCLLPPTFLMGATLPAISRWVKTTPEGVSWLGFFYGGNIAGAVLGSLLTGFYLLRVYDIAIATFVGIAINVAVAAAAWWISKSTTHSAPESADDAEASPDAGLGLRGAEPCRAGPAAGRPAGTLRYFSTPASRSWPSANMSTVTDTASPTVRLIGKRPASISGRRRSMTTRR